MHGQERRLPKKLGLTEFGDTLKIATLAAYVNWRDALIFTQECAGSSPVAAMNCSKMMVRCESSRSQHQNKYSALELLATRLAAQQQTGVHTGYNNIRREQIGSGERGDKIRTIRFQDNIVIDHASGQKWDLTTYLKGDWPTSTK